ncbi:ABC transporter ATP-binding protein [Photobacterium halotolerans]|uniref:ABC transporter ATP-binding protein n=1 Tax=Photobacterium halotolerans TaxID=265726 RepID=UPI00137293D3|nr:ABC transporter ATP-binding protein [Photobacterium halotolerans]NAW85877.1 ATP-binding cassette domain-containing protein [Photobacterium halotolerans]NAX48512.1 ATP-binding cassette domain-containing protein [Photobacterium halotolerans]
MSELAIKATGLTRRFGDFTAVNKLNLQVPSGHIYGFLGPNGCGKSTTLRMLTGLLSPSEGEIEVLGLRIPEQAEALRMKIGYMTQKFSLYEDLSVRENLQFIGQIYGLPGRELKPRVAELGSIYNLNELMKQRVGSMSGGQKQRLALAAAVMHKPDLLFLDEPTSAVDPQSRRDFWEQLFDLSDSGTTILVTTHYMDEAERCHGLAIMEAGEIKADGPPDTLMKQMGVSVVEIKAPGLRQIKERLLVIPAVVSAAQLGIRLRVLVRAEESDPVAWLKRQLPALAQAELDVVRPSLEDVFVTSTGSK